MRTLVLVLLAIAGAISSGCGGEAAGNDDSGDSAAGGGAGASAAEQGAGSGGELGSGEDGGNASADEAGAEPSEAGNGSGEPGQQAVPPAMSSTGGAAAPGVSVGVAVPAGMGPVGRPPGSGSIGDAPPPENCEPTATSGAEEFCEVQMSCDNDAIYTSCFDQGNGTWACDCGGNYFWQSLEVTGVDGASACDVVSEFCTSGEEPDATQSEPCSTDFQSQASDYCELQQRCGQSFELADGVVATRYDYKYANCYDDGSGAAYCQCNDNTTSRTYQISGQSVGASCPLVLDLCASAAEPEFDGPKTCEIQYQSAASGYCDTEQQCTQSSEVSDTVTALQIEWQSAYCEDSGGGLSSCSCFGEAGSLRFDIADAPTDTNTCSGALDVCSSIDELDLSGDLECGQTFQSASGASCDAQVACGQEATLGDQELTVYGDLYLNCQLEADSAWNCSCNSSLESANLELDASLESWDACTQAAEQCPDLVEVGVGGGGGGFIDVGRPVPEPLPAPMSGP